MNPDLAKLQPYPFEKLRALFAGVTPDPGHAPISLSIGEPKHATPAFIMATLTRHLGGLAAYPATAGLPSLREAIAAWLVRRYRLPAVDPATQVLPVNGSREALFAIAQVVIDRTRDAAVLCPNPFYQIYEGAALLAGAAPVYANATPARRLRRRLRGGTGCALAAHAAPLRLLAGQSDRARHDARRVAGSCSISPTGTAS